MTKYSNSDPIDRERGLKKEADISLDLEHFFPYKITRLTSQIAVTFAKQHAQKFGLSIPEWRVVALLGHYGFLSSGAITEKSNMDKAKVSRAVTRLVAAGLLDRQNNENDMRSHSLKLTRKGRAIHDKIVPIAYELEAELKTLLSESELEIFNQVLDRMYDYLLNKFGPESNADPHV